MLHTGSDGEYTDGPSGLGGASSSRTVNQSRKRVKPEPQKFDWALHDITKMYVISANGDKDNASFDSRTILVFNSNIQRTVDRWVH